MKKLISMLLVLVILLPVVCMADEVAPDENLVGVWMLDVESYVMNVLGFAPSDDNYEYWASNAPYRWVISADGVLTWCWINDTSSDMTWRQADEQSFILIFDNGSETTITYTITDDKMTMDNGRFLCYLTRE